MTDLTHSETISKDKEFGVNVYGELAYDGKNLQRRMADALAQKIVVDGSYTYIASAAPGTAESEAKWQVKRIDESVGGTTLITWADGDSEFDNVATNLGSLTYA